jgi:ribonuclease VapC
MTLSVTMIAGYRTDALMVIDTSAIIAILFDEEGADALEHAIETDPIRLISAASVLETSIVAETRFGEPGGRELDLLLHKAGIETVSVTSDQVEIARRAYREYGKGRHPASLNFGDCFSYALSKMSGEPLLFKGEDFARTNVDKVL